MPQKWSFSSLLKDWVLTFLNLFCNESLYCLLSRYTRPMLKKNLVPETKMLLANQIVGFLNLPYLWNKKINSHKFLHVDANSWKLKVDWKNLGVHDQKWVWLLQSCGSKIGCISRMNRWKLCLFMQAPTKSRKL